MTESEPWFFKLESSSVLINIDVNTLFAKKAPVIWLYLRDFFKEIYLVIIEIVESKTEVIINWLNLNWYEKNKNSTPT